LETARIARVDHVRHENFALNVVATGLLEAQDDQSGLHPSVAETAAQRFRSELLTMLRNADIGVVDIRAEEHDEPQGNRLRVRHEGSDENRSWLPVESESAGTIAMIRLSWPVIEALWFGRLLVVDELEASLHPAIALELIRLFNDPNHNPRGAQLLFATHDTNLLGRALDEPPLRRDQIWFTEKDREGATHLYALSDFEPRGEENLERGYLQGRYGAVPYLGNFAAAFGGKKDG
jgi:AAA15 family ATPase/GTPase